MNILNPLNCLLKMRVNYMIYELHQQSVIKINANIIYHIKRTKDKY